MHYHILIKSIDILNPQVLAYILIAESHQAEPSLVTKSDILLENLPGPTRSLKPRGENIAFLLQRITIIVNLILFEVVPIEVAPSNIQNVTTGRKVIKH